MSLIASIVQGILGLGFLASGGMKVAGAKQSLEQRDHLQVAPWFWSVTGVIEVIAAAAVILGIFLSPLFALAGAALLAATMAGAVFTHLAWAHDPIQRALPPIVLFALALVVLLVRLPALGA